MQPLVPVLPEQPVPVLPEQPVLVLPEQQVLVLPEQQVLVLPEQQILVLPEQPVPVLPGVQGPVLPVLALLLRRLPQLLQLLMLARQVPVGRRVPVRPVPVRLVLPELLRVPQWL